MKKGDSVAVGNYCYLDGDKHVKVSIAMDIISEAVSRECAPSFYNTSNGLISFVLLVRRYKDLATIAYLCTPTDAHVISEDAYKAQQRNAAEAPWWASFRMSMLLTVMLHHNAGIRNFLASSRARNSSPTRKSQYWTFPPSRSTSGWTPSAWTRLAASILCC
jgi:hypothetical protein